MTKPFVIGLTGSIGMGKSTAANIFREEGVPVWNADEAVHRTYSCDRDTIQKISEICPQAVAKNRVDREELSKWLAKFPDKLQILEDVVHPAVAADRRRFLEGQSEDIVLLDIPLLFETGLTDEVDAIVVVTVDEREQERRVMAREGMTTEKFNFLMSKQVPDMVKRKRADFVIDTVSIDAARAQVLEILSMLRKTHLDA